jgi:hypothetical protein
LPYGLRTTDARPDRLRGPRSPKARSYIACSSWRAGLFCIRAHKRNCTHRSGARRRKGSIRLKRMGGSFSWSRRSRAISTSTITFPLRRRRSPAARFSTTTPWRGAHLETILALVLRSRTSPQCMVRRTIAREKRRVDRQICANVFGLCVESGDSWP